MANESKRIRLWAFVGMALSVYATYVELKAEYDEDYVAMCDISPAVSCSTVLNSVYGRGFGLDPLVAPLLGVRLPPNSVIGMLYYYLNIKCSYRYELLTARLQMVCAIVANVLSVYLAYLLVYVLKSMCIVCVATYIVNFALLLETYKLLQGPFPKSAETDHKRPKSVQPEEKLK